MSPLKSLTMRRAKEVVEIVRSKGYRMSMPEEHEDCADSYLECCGSVLRVVFFDARYSDGVIAKVTPQLGDCDAAFYSPQGLYVLSHSPEDVAAQLLKKAQIMARIAGPGGEQG